MCQLIGVASVRQMWLYTLRRGWSRRVFPAANNSKGTFSAPGLFFFGRFERTLLSSASVYGALRGEVFCGSCVWDCVCVCA